MSIQNGKPAVPITTPCFAARGAPYRSDAPYKRHLVGTESNIFSSLEDSLMTRPPEPQSNKHSHQRQPSVHPMKHEMMYGAHPAMGHPADPLQLMEPLCPSSLPPEASPQMRGVYPHHPLVSSQTHQSHHVALGSMHQHVYHGGYDRLGVQHQGGGDESSDLEAFADRFKQRRIKLGVTQADVGRALVHLKIPGVGTLSQSTICRFESLTLSRNNMAALRPVLQSWLEAAESQARGRKRDVPLVLPTGERKRKRTSITAVEKRSLEAYFAVQQRPSGEKIASIAEKLELKKSVVRVWFCNQRQKQKRMKYSASQGVG